MQLNIVKIGNSKGIRIPKKILDQCQVEDILELEVQNNIIVLKPIHKNPREGWAEAIEATNKKYGEEPVDHEWLEADLLGDTEMENWEW